MKSPTFELLRERRELSVRQLPRSMMAPMMAGV